MEPPNDEHMQHRVWLRTSKSLPSLSIFFNAQLPHTWGLLREELRDSTPCRIEDMNWTFLIWPVSAVPYGPDSMRMENHRRICLNMIPQCMLKYQFFNGLKFYHSTMSWRRVRKPWAWMSNRREHGRGWQSYLQNCTLTNHTWRTSPQMFLMCVHCGWRGQPESRHNSKELRWQKQVI
jgi:hypothetical protein